MKYHLKSILFMLTLVFIWLSVLAASAYQGRIILIVLNMLAALSAIAWLFALMHDKFATPVDDSHYLSESEIADIKRADTPVVSRSSLNTLNAKPDDVDDVLAVSALAVIASHDRSNDSDLSSDNDTLTVSTIHDDIDDD